MVRGCGVSLADKSNGLLEDGRITYKRDGWGHFTWPSEQDTRIISCGDPNHGSNFKYPDRLDDRWLCEDCQVAGGYIW